MAIFAVTLQFTGDTEKLQAVRSAHREYMKKVLDEGNLVDAGHFADDSGALMIFDVEDLAAAQEQLANDPYTPGGIIAKATIKEWNVVVSRHSG